MTTHDMSARRSARSDAGVTLTELLITVVILGVIIVPLGNALIGLIRFTDDTSIRLNESHDVQIAAAYFAQDVQSIGTRDWTSYPYPLRQSVELGVGPTSGLYPCGSNATPTALLRLAWDDPETAAGTPRVVRVAYVIVVTGAARELHRVVCQGSATPVADIVIAHNVDAAVPLVTCSTTCTAVAVPASITLTLTIRNPSNSGNALTVALTGQRRQT